MKLALVLCSVAFSRAWVWDASQKSRTLGGDGIPVTMVPSHGDDASRLPKIYSAAIRELQELESEPLCHRTAARLLVNDCQILEGKDEATVLTDSGRQLRDFVDFYAASLAICDLERGSFVIPTQCARFREGSLSLLPVSQPHQLHVSSKEIDSCLAGLAKSDSAWSTWVSYRHKALRFCEAARADNEKTQSIRLYQRITKVLANLTNRVDEEMERRMENFDSSVREARANIENLKPQIGDLGDGLSRLEDMLSNQLEQIAKNSARTLHRGLEQATSLQRILSLVLASALEANAEVAASHEKAMDMVKARTDGDLDNVRSALAAVAASSLAIDERIKQSDQAVTAIETRQRALAEGLATAVELTQVLSARFDAHDEQLGEATIKAATILGTLDEASEFATNVRGSISGNYGIFKWWPCVAFPVFSLFMGSYGLPPSCIRNIGLAVFGEGLGLAILAAGELAKSHLPLSDYSRGSPHFIGVNVTGEVAKLGSFGVNMTGDFSDTGSGTALP